MRQNVKEFGVTFFDMGSLRQGIVHIIGPEQGYTQPGMTIVCGDSHTSTHGAFGAFALGIGTTQVEQVLATQCLVQAKLKVMEVRVNGPLPYGVSAKDLALGVIGQIGIRRRPRLRPGVHRRGHTLPVHGRSHDGMQHVHRGWCPGGHGSARRLPPSSM